MQNIDESLKKLKKSKFRSSFHLKEKDKEYVRQQGYDKIRSHAEDFISERLAPGDIPNDGKQTPMKHHPVFIAQHATACCCRGCLQKWYHIEPGYRLNKYQQKWIVDLIMEWIREEMGEKQ